MVRWRPRRIEDTTNARDGIHQGGGSPLLISPAVEGAGCGATIDVALQF